MLFTHDPVLAQQAEATGIDRIVVDFEYRGKDVRQSGYHLEVNKATLADLKKIRQAVGIPILARTNPISSESRKEISAIISEGADIVMLPMFRTSGEVEDFLEFAGDKAAKSLLFETNGSAEIAPELARMNFEEYYIGLNDMAIEFNLPFAYDVLRLDIIQRIRTALPDRPFGFGGITVIGGGHPLKTTEILKALAQYGCSLVILRRAFKRDIEGRELKKEVLKIKEFYSQLTP